MKYIRVYSDNYDGQIFTVAAFDIVKTQLCNGNTDMFESKEISSVEVGANEKIHDVSDLTALGYIVPDDAGNSDEDSELTEQSDEEFFDTIEDEDTDLDDDSEEGYF